MIKRYKQFVEGKLNEDLTMAAPGVSPVPTETPTETPTRPRPVNPNQIPTEIPAEEDAPLAQYEEEEEGGQYIGQKMMNELAEKLGTEVVDGAIQYNGQTINFYSETEMFHIGKKKFKTPDEVIAYLEMNDGFEMNSGEVADAQAEEDLEKEFESKSYKFTRKLKPSRKK